MKDKEYTTATASNFDGEHYDAQIKYAEMLREFIDISWWNLIRKLGAFSRAEKFRQKHMKCCYWANET